MFGRDVFLIILWAGTVGLGLAVHQWDTFANVEELFRVSVFAQTLGTSVKVSPARLEKQWDKVTV